MHFLKTDNPPTGSGRARSAAGATGGLQRDFRGLGPAHSCAAAFHQRLQLGVNGLGCGGAGIRKDLSNVSFSREIGLC